MTPSEEQQFEHILQARLDGQQAEVPAELAAELEQAIAAHAALQGLLDQTIGLEEEAWAARRPPSVSSDYRIERELGHGGMGVVYLAHQRSLDRNVALKVLRPGKQTFGPIVDRFLKEAQHLARLRHPNIVAIHEVGHADGEPYFTMDYVDGDSLTAALSRGALTPSRAVDILKQVAAAVQFAHRHGIIHRDLKPGNVLIDGAGHAFVTDFGLARNIRQDASLTQSGELLGTPQYMSPEQARGESSSVGEATDIHALGLLLFEMLTGRPAFEASSPAEALVKLLHEEPPLLRRLDRRVSRDLETICLKCLQKAPAARYANVSALLEDIRRYEEGEALAARRPSFLAQGTRWCRRHWKLAAAAIIAAVVTLGIASQLFDRSFEDLVAWGDEELATGHPSVAAQVYSRAFEKASNEGKQQLVSRMVQTSTSLGSTRQAVELALQVIDVAPDVSFGRNDYLVAQALVARERSRSPSGVIERTAPTPSLELTRRRLEMALAQGVPKDQIIEVEETLNAIKLVLSEGQPAVRYLPDYLHQLPKGTIPELQSIRDDTKQPQWTRARAAIALGKQLEDKGETDAATDAYRQAYELVRQVYPMYRGAKAAVGSALSRHQLPDAEECQLVQKLVADLRRLSSDSVPEPSGAIEFELEGIALPPTTAVQLIVELCDPAIDNPDAALAHNLPRLIPLRTDGPTRFEVLDGKYRLRCRGRQMQWEASAQRFAQLLQVDIDHWPDTVEIRGNTLTLPSVRLRLAEEIALHLPANGANVDLDDAVLEWQAIEGATSYQVNLLYWTESPSPTKTFFLTATAARPRLRFSALPDFDKQQIMRNLKPGRTAGWRVDAFDSQGKKIAAAIDEFRFLVASPLAAN